MPETLERDLERYVAALTARVSAAASTPGSPSTRRRPSRRGRVLMAAALIVLVAGVTAVLAWPGEDAEDGPVLTDTTLTPTTDTTPPPEVEASPWITGTDPLLDAVEHSPHAVWMLTDFFVLFAESGGADPVAAAVRPQTGEVRPLAPPPFGWRTDPTVVWTGREVLVVGGASDSTGTSHLGAAYDPVDDSWQEIVGPAELSGNRVRPAFGTGVWNGSELVFWTAGWSYHPDSDSWSSFPEPPLSFRGGYATVAIGEDILVWGGCEPVVDCYRDPDTWLTDGALYDATTGQWEALPDAPLGAAPFAVAVSDGLGATIVTLQVGDDGSGEEGSGDTAARFVPGEGWLDLPDPDGVPWFGTALAQVGDAVVLSGPSADGDQHLVLASGAAGWSSIPAPNTPRRSHVVTDGSGYLLLVGGDPAGSPELLPVEAAWDRDVPVTLDIPLEVEESDGAPFLELTLPDDLPAGTAYLSIHVDDRLRARSSASAGTGGSRWGTRLEPGTTVSVHLVAEDIDMLPLARTAPVTIEVP